MAEAAPATRSFVYGRRLPLAGTRIAATREAHQRRAAATATSTFLDALHRDACRLAAKEAQCRLVQAQLLARLTQNRFWHPLGFARLSDYAAERLGMRARSIQEDARVVTALANLARIRVAVETGAIRWTHARLLAGVATPASEDEWLRLALVSTTRELAGLVKAPRNRSSDEGSTANIGESARVEVGPDACASANVNAAAGGAVLAASDESEAADPPFLWNIVVTRAGRRLWRTVGDLASRMCGMDVPLSCVAEAVAAEAMSWDAWEPPVAEPLQRRVRTRRRDDESFERDSKPDASFPFPEPELQLQKLLVHLDRADAHETDARLRRVRSVMQQIDAELGTALRRALEQNVPRRFGFPDLRSYAEAKLGICGSKAMALVRLDRQCALQSPALLRAYREGEVTWLAATTLLRVISRLHEDAWIGRARQVTLRRLEAEVSWALDRADELTTHAPQGPPPVELDVTADAMSRCMAADIQMRAHPETDLESFGRRVDARIALLMPESVGILLEDAIEGCRHSVEPRWRGFERILAHAWLTWMALPQRDDSVYARDSYRCQVPGCRSRGRLHAHHVWFRSKGGPDFAWNLSSVCEYHHRAIHRGEIRVYGRAPDGLVWELGCRPGHPSLMRLRGDVYSQRPPFSSPSAYW